MHDTLPPRWLDDKKILESLFCEDFLTAYPMVAMADGCNVADFMTSEGYIKLDWTGESSSRDLYRAYTNWCEDNAFKPLSQRSFSNHLNENATKYGLDYNNNIYIGGKRRVRGYHGVQIINEFL